MRRLFVTGTDTDVGKTFATTLLVDFLKQNDLSFHPFKPVQTGGIKENGKLLAPDAEVYKFVMRKELQDAYQGQVFTKACSPHLSAAMDNSSVNVPLLTKTIEDVASIFDGVLIEGAGGLYVPLDRNGYCLIDWMEELKVPVIIVAKTGVGTINHTVLTVEALQKRNIPIAGILFNEITETDPEISSDNFQMIHKLTGVHLIGTIPFCLNIEETLTDPEKRKFYFQNWKINMIKEALESGSTSIAGKK